MYTVNPYSNDSPTAVTNCKLPYISKHKSATAVSTHIYMLYTWCLFYCLAIWSLLIHYAQRHGILAWNRVYRTQYRLSSENAAIPVATKCTVWVSNLPMHVLNEPRWSCSKQTLTFMGKYATVRCSLMIMVTIMQNKSEIRIYRQVQEFAPVPVSVTRDS